MTSIEWTDESWNPLRAMAGAETVKHGWACVRVSPGCKNCYAATFNKRLGTGLDYTVPDLARVETYLDEAAVQKPFHWRRPRKVFVCSMTDLFGEWVTDDQLNRIFDVMEATPRHTFQVLTKRPERMRSYLSWRWGNEDGQNRIPSRHIWLGTSVEDQRAADERIPHLLATPAAVRFLSCEPLLGPVDLDVPLPARPAQPWFDARSGLDWVIIGGESGPRARPMDLAWARSLVAQCRAVGVAPFVKQLGAEAYEVEHLGDGNHGEHDHETYGVLMRESHGRDMAEWPADLRIREWPMVTA